MSHCKKKPQDINQPNTINVRVHYKHHHLFRWVPCCVRSDSLDFNANSGLMNYKYKHQRIDKLIDYLRAVRVYIQENVNNDDVWSCNLTLQSNTSFSVQSQKGSVIKEKFKAFCIEACEKLDLPFHDWSFDPYIADCGMRPT